MTWRGEFRTGLATVLAVVLACPPAQALVALNDGRERIFVTGSVTASHDSNVFANSDNAADYVISSNILAEYTRRAGWIGVNGSVSVSASNFGENRDQNFSNPSYALEFTKQGGRTTGSLSFSGARESRADAAVNMRSTSWNYNTGLNVKYPAGVNTFTSSVTYSSRRYLDKSVFTDLATYATSLDVIRILPAERELVAGYRYRFSETSRNTSTTDHSATVGVQGKIVRGVVGSLRGGWQMRVPHGGVAGQPTFSSWTFSGTTSYALTKKMNVGLQASKDFSTTATDSSVDVTSASLDTSYAVNSKIAVNFNGGWGMTRFLGEGGRVVLNPGPPAILGEQRKDNYLSWSTGVSYAFHEHLKLGASYNWFQNWSSNSYADFIRQSWSFSATSRW
jgi:hypothetical protein